MDLYILHAGISHPSPYFYNLEKELKQYPEINVIINPNLPTIPPRDKGIVYFNRLKRFYDSNDLNSSKDFLKKIDNLKEMGWKIVWTVHNFFPIDRDITAVDDYVVREFINRADLLFTLSEYMRKSIKENYGKEAINHSMGINDLSGIFDKEIIKLDEIPKNAILFSFVGNIYKYKLLNVLIDKFNKLEMPNVYLLIAGPKAANQKVDLNITNKNIIVKDGFIGDSSWEIISERTTCFVCMYDLKLPAFKYGFFPSNIVKISSLKKMCLVPESEIIRELADQQSLIEYNFEDSKDFSNKIDYIIKNIDKIKLQESKIKQKAYSWSKLTKIFVEGIKKLYE